MLIDVYQQAVAGEDVPSLLADVSDVLGHVQFGDFPGRKEPGSGELDFRKILATLDVVGYRAPSAWSTGRRSPGERANGPSSMRIAPDRFGPIFSLKHERRPRTG